MNLWSDEMAFELGNHSGWETFLFGLVTMLFSLFVVIPLEVCMISVGLIWRIRSS